MSRYGTSHFISFEAACSYYVEYRPELKTYDPDKSYYHKSLLKCMPPKRRELTLVNIAKRNARKMEVLNKWIQHKLDEGEIHIGPPMLKHCETLHVIHDEGRYAIDDGKP